MGSTKTTTSFPTSICHSVSHSLLVAPPSCLPFHGILCPRGIFFNNLRQDEPYFTFTGSLEKKENIPYARSKEKHLLQLLQLGRMAMPSVVAKRHVMTCPVSNLFRHHCTVVHIDFLTFVLLLAIYCPQINN